MKKLMMFTLLPAVCVLALTAVVTAQSNGGGTGIIASLTGYEETPASLATPASGQFTGTISADRTSIDYQLSYDGFETDAMVAHIHLGQRATGGGVTVFLCGGGGRPACPARSGSVTGTITADDVGAIPSQGLAAGDLPKLLEAMAAGATYANVHSMAHGGGEIRGQISVQASAGGKRKQ